MKLRKVFLLESPLLKSATANASPIANVAVVLAVGASPIGHASSLTDTSSATSLFFANVEVMRPVRATTGMLIRLTKGKSFNISSVSPLFEMAITTSCRASMPRSPWMPSAGWRKNAGVPVLAIVAAIFCPIKPDFPIPDTTTLPLQCKEQVDGLGESIVQSIDECLDGARFDLQAHVPAVRLPPFGLVDGDEPSRLRSLGLPRRISA